MVSGEHGKGRTKQVKKEGRLLCASLASICLGPMALSSCDSEPQTRVLKEMGSKRVTCPPTQMKYFGPNWGY